IYCEYDTNTDNYYQITVIDTDSGNYLSKKGSFNSDDYPDSEVYFVMKQGMKWPVCVTDDDEVFWDPNGNTQVDTRYLKIRPKFEKPLYLQLWENVNRKFDVSFEFE